MKKNEKIEDYKIPIEICNKYGIDLIYIVHEKINTECNLSVYKSRDEKIKKLNNQKDISLAFIGKPTKKEHYKTIIAIYEQYEKELNKLLL